MFLNSGLQLDLFDFDTLGKNEKLGSIHVPDKTLYQAKGERLEFKLGPPGGTTTPVSGYLALRCRRASEEDIQFIKEYYQKENALSRINKKATPQVAEGTTGASNLKSLITKRSRIAKDGKNAGKRQVCLELCVCANVCYGEPSSYPFFSTKFDPARIPSASILPRG